jgi:hypothetical protein
MFVQHPLATMNTATFRAGPVSGERPSPSVLLVPRAVWYGALEWEVVRAFLVL